MVLKVRDPSQPLEGERHTQKSQKSEILQNSDEIEPNSPVDDSSEPNLVAEASNNPDSLNDYAEPMDIDDPLPPTHLIDPGAAHDPHDMAKLNDDVVASELLTEDPISLAGVLDCGDPTLDIHNRIADQYGEDSLFKQIIEKPANYRNFEISNRVVYLKDNEKQILCIPDIKVGERQLRETLISHAHSILAHLGPRKTVTPSR